ncbi:MAG: hypothetical protein EBZ77_13680, partial [Chitinophagia bacterium]|nr:hypothetical protein [Chitinophagia bacterium]
MLSSSQQTKIANVALNYALTKAAAPPPAGDIVDMNSFGGGLADYLAQAAWGGERAGRSKAMADAMGEPTTMTVKHPITASFGHMLGGGALGALAGAGFGAAAVPFGEGGHNLKDFPVAGALLGGALGMLGGIPYSSYKRRQEMRRLNELYDKKRQTGDINPKHPSFSGISALLLPDRGPHRTGQLEASRAMAGGPAIREQRPMGRDLLYALRALPYAGYPISILHDYGQNLRTQLADDTTSKKEEKKEPRSKAANALDYALTKAASRQNVAPMSQVSPSAAPAASAFDWRHALLGAGVGAGAGALSGLFAPGKDDEDEKDVAGSAMWRGLLGGALGGAAGGFGGKY